MTVYVRWYGNVVQGELLDGEYLGMKQVRIPLDGHHPIALFTPGHVCESVEKMQEVAKEVYSYPKQFPKPEDIIRPDLPTHPANDYLKLEIFKRDNWDHEHNHLRIDKLDEFYKLWRMAMTPFGFVEAEAPKRIVSDEKMEELKQQLKEKLDKLPESHPAPKPASKKPSKKMLRSTGQQQFNDSTQLSLFD